VSWVMVKICGLTNLDDAAAAWNAGADLLGFVMVPSSPRYVPPPAVGEIMATLRARGCDLTCVAVTCEPSPAVVNEQIRASGANMVQLHGMSDAMRRALSSTLAGDVGRAKREDGAEDEQALRVSAIVAHRVQDGTIDWEAIAAIPAYAHVLDTYDPDVLGGSGRAWDWAGLGSARGQRLRDDAPRIIVAGGLSPENVAQAVNALHPWGVDVSSGVEARPGRKDHRALERFVGAVRAEGVCHGS